MLVNTTKTEEALIEGRGKIKSQYKIEGMAVQYENLKLQYQEAFNEEDATQIVMDVLLKKVGVYLKTQKRVKEYIEEASEKYK